MTGQDKAAVFLLYIGTEASAKIFSYLEDDEIKKIGQSMTRLGHVPVESITEVVDEYNQLTDPETGIFSQGEDMVRKLLEKALGPQKAEVLLQELYSTSNEDIVDILSNMDAKTVANYLSQEHPQTISVVLAKLRPKQTGEIISHLPQDLQANVVMRIADIDQISPEVLSDVEDAMRKELSSLGSVQRYRVGGVERVVELFNHLDRTREKQILDRLDAIKPALAEVIRKHLFTFEDIFRLDNRTVQMVMREISNDILTLAMKTCPEDIKEKIFQNISSRAAESIRDDLETMGPVRLADVEKAQSEIIKIVRRMEEEGKVVLGRGGDDVLV